MPSIQPKVSQVSEWRKVRVVNVNNHWKGEPFDGTVTVSEGYPFAEFYKVEFVPNKGRKTSKLFFGETSWSDTIRYVYDISGQFIDL